jgi:hypothetical protein
MLTLVRAVRGCVRVGEGLGASVGLGGPWRHLTAVGSGKGRGEARPTTGGCERAFSLRKLLGFGSFTTLAAFLPGRSRIPVDFEALLDASVSDQAPTGRVPCRRIGQNLTLRACPVCELLAFEHSRCAKVLYV